MEQFYAQDASNSSNDTFSTMAILDGDIPSGYGASPIISGDERVYNCRCWVEEQNFFGRLDFNPEYDDFWTQQAETWGSREAETENEKDTVSFSSLSAS
jgi:hypothetical protein